MRNHPLCLAVLAIVVSACNEHPESDPPLDPPQASTPGDPQTPPPNDADHDHDPGVPVLPSARAKQVVTGHLHACALTTDGGVRCWGYTEYGQLGNGMVNRTPHTAVPIPVQVQGLESGVQQIATSFRTTCALTAAGGVKCWGSDQNGELGTGIPYVDSRPKLSAVPVDVKDLGSGVRSISVGSTSACAVLATGGVKCWGLDEYGKLGNDSPKEAGDSLPDSLPPVDVVGLAGRVAEVSVGDKHACAVTEEGALQCWGANMGALGIPETANGSYGKPQDVPSLGKNVAHVYAGSDVTCVVTKNGAAKCFGDGSKGQLGDGKDGILRTVYEPVDVIGLSGITQMTNAGYHTCAIANGGVQCWGYGEIGSSDPSFSTFVPKQVQDLTSGWSSISASSRFNCIVSTDGAAKCWGENGGGTLGDGKGGFTGLERSDTPIGVVSLP